MKIDKINLKMNLIIKKKFILKKNYNLLILYKN